MGMNFRNTILKEGNSHKKCILDYPTYMKFKQRQNKTVGLGQLSGYSQKAVTGKRQEEAGGGHGVLVKFCFMIWVPVTCVSSFCENLLKCYNYGSSAFLCVCYESVSSSVMPDSL